MILVELILQRPTYILHNRHSGMFLAGLNLPGADLNSLWLVRRMKYMDVFHNPVTKALDACLRRHDEYIFDINTSREQDINVHFDFKSLGH